MKYIYILIIISAMNILLSGCSDPAKNVTPTIEMSQSLSNQLDLSEKDMGESFSETETAALEPTATQTVDSLSCIPENTRRVVGRVIGVIDGDTIRVRVGSLVYTVRYIGIDAPSARPGINDYEYFGDEATLKNKELVEGQTVTMIYDVSDMDNFGRMIRYVIVNDTFINYELVSQGYARSYLREPDVACQDLFDFAESEASRMQRGMWAEEIIESSNMAADSRDNEQKNIEITSEYDRHVHPSQAGQTTSCIPEESEREYGEVVSVVDGDTIRVKIEGEISAVRYIGVNAPIAPLNEDEGEYYGKESLDFNNALVNKKNVVLLRDKSDVDNFGKKLRYVMVDDVFVNYEMIANGFALVDNRPPDTACQALLNQAEQNAREQLSGIWLFWSLPVIDKNVTPVP